MKKIFTTLLFIASLFAFACNDDSQEVFNEVESAQNSSEDVLDFDSWSE